MRTPRFWVSVLVLFATLLVLYRRGDTDLAPSRKPLDQFPVQLSGWLSTDVPINPDTLQVMGKGDFLNRLYSPDATVHPAPTGPIALFIGYFPTQRTGQSIHSPQNCLPGSGWTFVHSGRTKIVMPDGASHRVGDYIITDGTAHDEVLYWYQTQGRTIADDYKAKLIMVVDSIRFHRSDAALVRVVTPIRSGETDAQAHQRVVDFSQKLFTFLPAYIPN